MAQIWEREYPRRGLGYPKRLPHSRRPGYAPILHIHANGDILLDDQHVATARSVTATFEREVIRESSIGQVVQTLRPGAISAKVVIELPEGPHAAISDALSTVYRSRYNGSPNLRATAKGGMGYAGTIVSCGIRAEDHAPRYTVTLDLAMVTITTG